MKKIAIIGAGISGLFFAIRFATLASVLVSPIPILIGIPVH